MRNNEYRLNVRFDLNDEKQRRIAQTLQTLDRKKYQSINAFVVTAVGDYLDRLDNNGDLTLDRIRAMFREELQSVSFVSAPPQEKNALDTSHTEEQQEENDDKVLDGGNEKQPENTEIRIISADKKNGVIPFKQDYTGSS